MGLPNIREYMHAHCRFRLRSGREVYGVVWEVETNDECRLYFATIGEYERSRREPHRPMEVMPMVLEDILLAERLAG
ncbi:MAG: hypothetical protein M9900_12260 [Flavobacteriales bacterium]|nr:hypothetical protein [Flavobacteriales bacterium]HRO39020.1 hypothetical protein [Flavobacteriales bacterium]